MSAERVDAIRARLEAVTPGPWQTRSDKHAGDETLVVADVRWGGANYVKIAVCDQPRGAMPGQADAELIANAPADIEFLLGEVERLRRENQELRRGIKREIASSDEVAVLAFGDPEGTWFGDAWAKEARDG